MRGPDDAHDLGEQVVGWRRSVSGVDPGGEAAALHRQRTSGNSANAGDGEAARVGMRHVDFRDVEISVTGAALPFPKMLIPHGQALQIERTRLPILVPHG